MIKNRPRRAGAAWIKYEEDKRYEPHGDKGSDRVSILVCHVRESAPELAVLSAAPHLCPSPPLSKLIAEGKDAPLRGSLLKENAALLWAQDVLLQPKHSI